MNGAFVIPYLKRRMKELGVKRYSIRWRHLSIPPGTTLPLLAYGQLAVLITDHGLPLPLVVESEFGHYDLSGDNREQHHEFRGKILVKNKSSEYIQVEFVHVNPKRKKS